MGADVSVPAIVHVLAALHLARLVPSLKSWPRVQLAQARSVVSLAAVLMNVPGWQTVAARHVAWLPAGGNVLTWHAVQTLSADVVPADVMAVPGAQSCHARHRDLSSTSWYSPSGHPVQTLSADTVAFFSWNVPARQTLTALQLVWSALSCQVAKSSQASQAVFVVAVNAAVCREPAWHTVGSLQVVLLCAASSLYLPDGQAPHLVSEETVAAAATSSPCLHLLAAAQLVAPGLALKVEPALQAMHRVLVLSPNVPAGHSATHLPWLKNVPPWQLSGASHEHDVHLVARLELVTWALTMIIWQACRLFGMTLVVREVCEGKNELRITTVPKSCWTGL